VTFTGRLIRLLRSSLRSLLPCSVICCIFQKTTLALAALSVPPDVELQHGFARKVHSSFKSADAFFFVVPTRYSAIRFQRASHELDLIPRTAAQPILVVAIDRTSLNLHPIDQDGCVISAYLASDPSTSLSQSYTPDASPPTLGANSVEGDGNAVNPVNFPSPNTASSTVTNTGNTSSSSSSPSSSSSSSPSSSSSSVATGELVEGQYLTSCQIARLLGLQHTQRRWSVWTVSDSTDVLNNLQLIYKGCVWLSRVAG
jgi:hypothetical protein